VVFLNALDGPPRQRPGPVDGRGPEKCEGGGQRPGSSAPGPEGRGLESEWLACEADPRSYPRTSRSRPDRLWSRISARTNWPMAAMTVDTTTGHPFALAGRIEHFW